MLRIGSVRLSGNSRVQRATSGYVHGEECGGLVKQTAGVVNERLVEEWSCTHIISLKKSCPIIG